MPSIPITVLCATIPSVPAPPTTTNLNNLIVVSWNAPSGNGLVITSYTILIQTITGSFVQDSTYCVGYNPTIVATTTCTIPMSVLYSAPYSLTILSQV